MFVDADKIILKFIVKDKGTRKLKKLLKEECEYQTQAEETIFKSDI